MVRFVTKRMRVGKRAGIMENDVKKTLVDEFKNDPIYKMVEFYELEEDLFTDGILGMNMDPDYTYSTTEASKILGRPDSTIRNYFHTDLIEYIGPEKWGKFYRLNYRSIFKLRMIFTLVDKANKSSVDLLTALGVSPSIVIGDNEIKRTNQRTEIGLPVDLKNRLESFSDFMNRQSELAKLYTFQHELYDLRMQLNAKEAEKEREISQLEFKYLEDKQSIITDNYIRNLTSKPKFWNRNKKNKEIASALQVQINKIREKYQEEKEKIMNKYDKEIAELRTKITEKQTIIKIEQEKLALLALQEEQESRRMLINNDTWERKEEEEYQNLNGETSPVENKDNRDN